MTNILNIPTEANVDPAVLGAVFLARYELRMQSETDALEVASDEWVKAIEWFDSNSTQHGSFIWFCDALNIEPGAIRDKIKAYDEKCKT